MLSLPIIPDSLNKLFIVMGISLLILTGVITKTNYAHFLEAQTSKTKGLINLKFQLIEDSIILHKRVDKVNIKGRQEGFNELISLDDSPVHILSRYPKWMNDSLSSLKEVLLQQRLKHNQLERDQNLLDENFNVTYEEYKFYKEICNVFFNAGVVFLLVGIILWAFEDYIAALIKLRNNQYQSKCQSCGFGFNAIIKHGKELDNTDNKNFCTQCYTEGHLINEDMSINDMAKNIQTKLKQKNVVKDIKHIEKKLRSLDRWKQPEY